MSSDLQFAIQNPKSTTAQRSFVPRGFRRVLFLLMVVAAMALSFAGARWPAAKAAPETPESHRLKFVELFAAPIAVIPMAPTAMTFVVNTTNDTLLAGACAAATPGQCSLREAIVEANANPGADTLDATSVTGTINLTAALPNIVEDLTINGPGASLLTVRRSTGGVYRIFTVTTAGTVTFFGLTISNGNAGVWTGTGGPDFAGEGGGIANDSGGTVNVTNCVLSSNFAGTPSAIGEAGGIANRVGGTLNVTNSILSGNFVDSSGGVGGAITNAGTLNITDSTISGNYIKGKWDGFGGGIWSGGTAKITNSTISGNYTIIAGGQGGGIACGPGTLNVINSTITGNTSGVGGGIACGPGTLNVTNSTISGNSAAESGGGVDVFKASVTLKSTIVALNTAPSFPDLHGPIISQGYNIVGTTSGATIVATTGDQFGVTAAQLKLDPLANNGGPTRTMAIKSGSVAIDHGINSSSLTTDQRGAGFARTFDDPAVTNATGGDGTDVGAFEAQLRISNICETHPWICHGLLNICETHPGICHGLCEIPCPRCFAGCLYEIVFEDLVDPWKAIIFDPRGNPVGVQQMKRGNQVTMRFRVSERFADKVDEYTVVFRGGKPGTKPAARFQVKAIQ